MQPAQIISGIQLPPFEFWITPIVGVLAAGVALILGRRFGSSGKNARSPGAKSMSARSDKGSDPFQLGSVSERRSSLRRQGNPVEVVVADAETKKELARGCVVDRSMGGMRLQVDEPLDEGQILSVRPSNQSSETFWVEIQVRSCRLEGKNWELGCQFVRTPPWSQLLMFG